MDIKSIGVDSVICLGDIIGYGPSPVETLEKTYRESHHFVLGNHDAVISGQLSTDNFNDNAKKLIQWTCSQLDKKAGDFFNSLPLQIKGEKFRCAHGNFSSSGTFGYILEDDEARQEFQSCSEQLLFVGHSHMPGIFVSGKSGIPHWLEAGDFGVEEGKRYIVNVGSVGQPRDTDMRASYCIFDVEKGDVLFRRIPFDIDAYREDQRKNKIPEKSSYFVELYLTNVEKPLRETIGFKALSPENAVKAIAEVKDLKTAVENLRKTRVILLLCVVILACAAAASLYFYRKAEKEKAIIAQTAEKTKQELKEEIVKAGEKLAITAYKSAAYAPLEIPAASESEIISAPSISGEINKGNPLKNWKIEVSTPDKQKISTEIYGDKKYKDIPIFRIRSETTDDLMISFLPVKARAGMTFSASAQFKKNSLSAGHIALQLVLEKKDGTALVLEQNIPNEIKESGNWTRRTSVTLSKDKALREDGLLYFVIKGNFQGEILVRNLSLIEKK
jgi:predicted phosphodiesterase